MVQKKKIGIIGLGYVGLPLAVEFGKFRQVIGYDIKKSRINSLKNNIDITLEVNSKSLIDSEFLQFTDDKKDLNDCEIYIITVPTPIDDVNRPDLSQIISATKLVGHLIKVGDIVIFESTVFPGCTEEVCVPILEKVSGLTFNKEFFCGYSPERVNPGDKVNSLTKIKKITSGSTPAVAEEIDALYNDIIEAGTFLVSSIKVAEAAKVIENTQRDLNIALINELSIIFQKLGIDTLDVLDAAGSKWNFLPFRPGLVGGHCIGVDPYYLTYKAEQVGYHPQIILAGRKINDGMAHYATNQIIKMMILNGINFNNSKVGILGITFKENCPDVRNSKILNMIYELESWGIDVVVSDPWADPIEVKDKFGISLGKIDANHQVDSLIVAVGHNEFRGLVAKDLKSFCKGISPVLADLKSLYKRKELEDLGFTLFRL